MENGEWLWSTTSIRDARLYSMASILPVNLPNNKQTNKKKETTQSPFPLDLMLQKRKKHIIPVCDCVLCFVYHPLGLWKKLAFYFLFLFTSEKLFFCTGICLLDCSIFLKAWLRRFLFPSFWRKKYQKVLFKLLLSSDTVMYMVGGNMMLCRTTPWTLSKTL